MPGQGGVEFQQAFGALGQNLEAVPVRLAHDGEYLQDKVNGTSWWNRSLMELTNMAWGRFQERGSVEGVLVDGEVEAVAVVGAPWPANAVAMRSA